MLKLISKTDSTPSNAKHFIRLPRAGKSKIIRPCEKRTCSRCDSLSWDVSKLNSNVSRFWIWVDFGGLVDVVADILPLGFQWLGCVDSLLAIKSWMLRLKVNLPYFLLVNMVWDLWLQQRCLVFIDEDYDNNNNNKNYLLIFIKTIMIIIFFIVRAMIGWSFRIHT